MVNWPKRWPSNVNASGSNQPIVDHFLYGNCTKDYVIVQLADKIRIESRRIKWVILYGICYPPKTVTSLVVVTEIGVILFASDHKFTHPRPRRTPSCMGLCILETWTTYLCYLEHRSSVNNSPKAVSRTLSRYRLSLQNGEAKTFLPNTEHKAQTFEAVTSKQVAILTPSNGESHDIFSKKWRKIKACAFSHY